MIQTIYDKLLDSSDYTIIDPRSVNWSTFEFTSGFVKHYVAEEEILKPYLISFQYYDTVEYEDELLMINGISDPFQMYVGVELRIPELNDLKQFILDNTR
jgi:hypothetical protein